MEIILGPLTWLIVGLGTAIYFKWFSTDIERDLAFERWCLSHPVVLALRCRKGGEQHLKGCLDAQLRQGRWVVNANGRFPWPFYRLKLEVVSFEGRVEARVVAADLVRGERSPRRLLELLEAFEPKHFELIEEVWLQGECYPSKRHSGADRSRFGWTGTLDLDGFHVTEMIGAPPWLAESHDDAAQHRAA
ncbi:MAG: hypothetical protein U0165_20835 [Polyangiaceae bacterium]